MKKILTSCRKPPELMNELFTARFPIYAVLDNIRSLYNVGSIFRTADASRIDTLHLCGITGRPPRKEIAKTALGAQDTVPWEYYPNAVDSVTSLKNRGVTVIGVEHTDVSTPLWNCVFSFPVAFVFGYEVEGISSETLESCDSVIEIPMYGYKGSLNVGNSCAIVLYEALRRYMTQVNTASR
ncbi:RNA methyltransferase [bacterium]|nr:RNA methyltransferase [candidate division CSSED10-310 bacterium]